MSDLGDEEVSDTVRRALQESAEASIEAQERIQRYQDGVRYMPGQLGVLLRQIGHAWAEFAAIEELGGTTTGEEIRLRDVLDEAMSTLDWLREGERP